MLKLVDVDAVAVGRIVGNPDAVVPVHCVDDVDDVVAVPVVADVVASSVLGQSYV